MKSKKTTYFLFGKDACRILIEDCADTLKPLIKAIEGGEIDSYRLYEYIEGETNPAELLFNYQGWEDYSTLTKREYNKLKKYCG